MGPKAGEHEGHMGPKVGEHEGHMKFRAGEHEGHIGSRAGEHEDHVGPRLVGPMWVWYHRTKARASRRSTGTHLYLLTYVRTYLPP